MIENGSNTPSSSVFSPGWNIGPELTGNSRLIQRRRISNIPAFKLKEQSPTSQRRYRVIFEQAILAMFYYHENGEPVMPEEWTFVITQLYRKKVGLEAEAMEPNGIKAVSLCFDVGIMVGQGTCQ
jgi:hypothetical protein